ncbi:unnamed protein product [Albugo candida]|uniref:Uncharacterized protein n=1 Tax=Albugo candida TaxID=65357 RepID=A0A024GM94_9STRA|nr:unnamed protein product [Albugo candida]|eukprot:CCI47662.1 unnamed protein product [Albugo candida]
MAQVLVLYLWEPCCIHNTIQLVLDDTVFGQVVNGLSFDYRTDPPCVSYEVSTKCLIHLYFCLIFAVINTQKQLQPRKPSMTCSVETERQIKLNLVQLCSKLDEHMYKEFEAISPDSKKMKAPGTKKIRPSQTFSWKFD